MLVAACAAASLGGCGFGPKAIEKTHGRYAESVRRVEEEQLLRQLVLLRYNETSVNFDIANIASQYELAATAEARPFFVAPNPSTDIFRTFTSILPDVSLSGSNRPTITLIPNTDGGSVRRYLTPITLETLIFLTQTSWPVDTVLRVWVERLNGVPNAVQASGPGSDDPPDYERFLRLTELFRNVQRQELAAIRTEEQFTEIGGPIPSESVTAAAMVEAAKGGFEYRPRDARTWSLVRKEKHLIVGVNPGAEKSPEMLEIEKLLNLVPGLSRYDVAVSNRGSPDPEKYPGPPAKELHLVPRSTAQAEYFLSNGVEAPNEHVCAGLVSSDNSAITEGLFAVHSSAGHKPPANAFVAVRYRGYWFYIDDRDQESKITFALMFHLSKLDFTRDPLRGPALTLPVGR